MHTQGWIRWTAAAMLAVALAMVAYLVFWWSAMQFAQKTLKERIETTFGAMVRYDAPHWNINPLEADLHVNNVIVTMNPPQAGVRVTLSLPSVQIRSGFFDADRRLVLGLPPLWRMIVEEGGKQKNVWVKTNTAELFFVRVGSEIQVGMKTPHIEIHQEAADGPTLLNAWNAYAIWSPSPRGAHVKVGGQNIKSEPGNLDDLLIDISMNRLEALRGQTWKVLLTRTPESVRGWLAALVHTSQKTGAPLDVPHVLFRQGPKALSMFGNMDVAPDGTAEGEVTVTSNRASDLREWIDATKLIQPGTPLDAARRARVMQQLEKKNPTANIVFHQGVVIMNTEQVGQSPHLSDVIKNAVPGK